MLKSTGKKRGEGKPETFDFLGFTHYCSRSRKSYFRVKRKTSKKKFGAKLKLFIEWVKQNRVLRKKELIEKLNIKLSGYYRYYGITDNFKALDKFWRKIVRAVFIWLNRRSQRKSYTWIRFYDMLKHYPIVRPKIYVSMYEI